MTNKESVMFVAPPPVRVGPKVRPEIPKSNASTIVTSPNARAVPFGVRTKRNPRPDRLDPEDVIRHALRCRKHLATIAHWYGHDGDALDVAVDVSARIVETASHLKYDPTRSSVDSWLAGAARNIYRKQAEVKTRHDRILSEWYAKDPTIRDRRTHTSDDQGSSLFAEVSRVRPRLTPSESSVLDVAVRVGPDASRISAALGLDLLFVRECLRGVRAAAGFLGIGGR